MIVSIALLARNENNFVEQKAALKEGEKNVISTSPTPLDSSLEGKLVYFNGETSSPAEKLVDQDFNILTDDLKLIRNVEMYQWKEDSEEDCHDNYGGGEECTTTYDYRKVWEDQPIDSSRFYQEEGHRNPTHRAYSSKTLEKKPILV